MNRRAHQSLRGTREDSDAHRVFFWTDPALPEGWHCVYADDEHPGTIVYIHE